MGVASFGWGALADCVGPRIVVLIGGLLLGLGLALASDAESLLEFQLVYAIVGVSVGRGLHTDHRHDHRMVREASQPRRPPAGRQPAWAWRP